MTKNWLIFTILVLCSMNAIAQKDFSAREILNKTKEQMQNNGAISATFTTTLFDGTTPQEIFSGTMDIKGQKYVMKTDAVCTWFNGQDQWTLVHNSNEVSLVTPTQDELKVSSPLSFMEIYHSGFKLSSKTAYLRGRKVWEVTMRPENRKQEPSSIVISIDQETYTPMCLRIRNNGDWTRISINDFSTRSSLPDEHFNFPSQDYPNYEVIDMR